MAYRSRGRLLAPLALALSVLAVVLIVGAADGGGDAATPSTRSTSKAHDGRHRGHGKRKHRRRTHYRVHPGDTLSSIAAAHGLSVDDLTALNPDLEGHTLRPGDRIRLRR